MNKKILTGLTAIVLGFGAGCSNDRDYPKEPEACSQIKYLGVFWMEHVKYSDDGSAYFNRQVEGSMNVCLSCYNSPKHTLIHVNHQGIVNQKSGECPLDLEYGFGTDAYLVRLCAMPWSVINAYETFCQEDIGK